MLPSEVLNLMINKKDLEKIKREIESFEELRERIIIDSREILHHSKNAIHSIHRNKLDDADVLLKKAREVVVVLNTHIKKDPSLGFVGAYRSSIQEYVEAACYYAFVKSRKLLTRDELEVDYEDYLLGLCDLTGELARRAVVCATHRDVKQLDEIKSLIEGIYDFFISINLRDWDLRKKADAIKWNLKKLEDIMYDLNLRTTTATPHPAHPS